MQDDEQLRVFNNQIEEDRKIIISRHNLVEMHKVLDMLITCALISNFAIAFEFHLLTYKTIWLKHHFLKVLAFK